MFKPQTKFRLPYFTPELGEVTRGEGSSLQAGSRIPLESCRIRVWILDKQTYPASCIQPHQDKKLEISV